MATYYYRGGLGTGNDDGTDAANAFKTFAQALAAATADGDIIKAHYTGQESLASDTTYTVAANITVVSVDFGSADAVTPMGTGGWIGHATLNRTIAITGAVEARFVGITLRISGSTADSMGLCSTDGADYTYEDCYFWQGNTVTGALITVGTSDGQAHARMRNCTFRFGHASQFLRVGVYLEIEGGSLTSDGTIPTGGFIIFSLTDPGGATVIMEGFDASALGSNPLVGDASTAAGDVRIANCKLGASFVLLAAQSVANKSGARVYAFDCASGDTHTSIAYSDAMGTLTVDSNIYLTAGPAQVSWKIVTSAAASPQSPFVTPWFDKYVAAGSVTPEIEILRDGSSTAYQDDEVWGTWAYKGTSGFPITTFVNDRVAVLGTPANQAAGAGLGAWTGENATAWSGKLSPGALTVAEDGYLRSRIHVGEPSITVYADPDV